MTQPEPAPRLAIVLVNWNRGEDTVECLESLLRSSEPVRVVVVDNASTDGSLERVERWARGEQPYAPPAGPLGRMTSPALDKPVAFTRLTADVARAQGLGPHRLTLIDAGANVGFAAGNNIALRAALRDRAIDYCWCLNNDTVVERDAAQALVQRMDSTHKIGMCGTQVRYYHRPGVVQALNGSRFKKITGASRGIHLNQPITRPFNPQAVARETDFVLGASIAVSRPFLQTVGFMEESYFLYFEEMDWSVRNRGRFRTAFAHGAVVYHKEGGSIGSSNKRGQRSTTAEYYLMRSRIKFYARNMPLMLPLQYPLGLAQIARRILRRQPDKAWVMTKALLGLRR